MDKDNKKPTVSPLRRAVARLLFFGMMVPGVVLMLVAHRAPLQSDWALFGVPASIISAIGMALFFGAIGIFLLMRKISPVGPPPDPAFIQSRAEALRAHSPVYSLQRWRLQILAILIPALLIILVLSWLLRQLQPGMPMLAGLNGADLQRIAIVAGIMIALAGYGMFRLLRRGDSGGG